MPTTEQLLVSAFATFATIGLGSGVSAIVMILVGITGGYSPNSELGDRARRFALITLICQVLMLSVGGFIHHG